jgi:transposase
MQSLIAICNKLIRVLFTIGKKQCVFSEERMLSDSSYESNLYGSCCLVFSQNLTR